MSKSVTKASSALTSDATDADKQLQETIVLVRIEQNEEQRMRLIRERLYSSDNGYLQHPRDIDHSSQHISRSAKCNCRMSSIRRRA